VRVPIKGGAELNAGQGRGDRGNFSRSDLADRVLWTWKGLVRGWLGGARERHDQRPRSEMMSRGEFNHRKRNLCSQHLKGGGKADYLVGNFFQNKGTTNLRLGPPDFCSKEFLMGGKGGIGGEGVCRFLEARSKAFLSGKIPRLGKKLAKKARLVPGRVFSHGNSSTIQIRP